MSAIHPKPTFAESVNRCRIRCVSRSERRDFPDASGGEVQGGGAMFLPGSLAVRMIGGLILVGLRSGSNRLRNSKTGPSGWLAK